MKDDLVYLDHILESIRRIEAYTAGGRETFFAENLVQDGVIYNLQTLAESTQKISADLKTPHSQIDWRAIGRFRNILVHNYLGIDLEQVWRVIAGELPKLKDAIEEMVEDSIRARYEPEIDEAQ